MKKTQKNLLGMFGLSIVVATTVFAACMPGPEASAAGSVTDTVTVRVVGDAPKVDITGVDSGSVITDGGQTIDVSYEVVDELKVDLKYTDKDGVEHTVPPIWDYFYDYQPGDIPLDLNLIQYGYGEFTITATGYGPDGVTDEDIITFEYIPVAGTATPDDTTGNPIVDLDYVPGDGVDPNGVEKIVITILDENGNPIAGIDPIIVDKPIDQVTLPFDEYGLPDGNYIIELTALGIDGEELYKPYVINFEYKGNGEEPVVPETGGDTGAPDTGGLFSGLNISNSDYLITGLLIFFTVGIGGAIFIVKRNQKSSKRR